SSARTSPGRRPSGRPPRACRAAAQDTSGRYSTVSLSGPFLPRMDKRVTKQQVRPGTLRRILPYAGNCRWALVTLRIAAVTDAGITAGSPLVLKAVIDEGILPNKLHVVIWLAVGVAVLALVSAVAVYVQTWLSARISEGLIYDLRTEVFDHVQRQPLAFF